METYADRIRAYRHLELPKLRTGLAQAQALLSISEGNQQLPNWHELISTLDRTVTGLRLKIEEMQAPIPSEADRQITPEDFRWHPADPKLDGSRLLTDARQAGDNRSKGDEPPT